MEMSVGSRLKHAWNAFLGNEFFKYSHSLGPSYSYRPDRPLRAWLMAILHNRFIDGRRVSRDAYYDRIDAAARDGRLQNSFVSRTTHDRAGRAIRREHSCI